MTVNSPISYLISIPRLVSVLIIPLSLVSLPGPVIAQVVLQPWVQVFGTVNGAKLGLEAMGITPSMNFPFKVSIYESGNTGMYTLQSKTDTIPQTIFLGTNLLTSDFEGDGYTDIILNKSQNGWDSVFVYSGTASGIDTLNPLILVGENQYDDFVAKCVGDINNDGYPDLVATARDYDLTRGKVYFYFGPTLSASPNAVLLGDTIAYNLGLACTISDLDADSDNDFVVRGQVSFPSGDFKYVRVYWGSPDTLALNSRTELRGSSESAGALAAFDVNGDGIEDLLWTNSDGGPAEVWVHFGGATFDSVASVVLDDPDAPGQGHAIINGGDMNGDGYNEVVVAAPRATITSGFVFVYGGGPEIDGRYDAAVGMSSDSEFGWSVAGVGDVSGDGLSDIIVGAPNYAFGDDRGYWGIFLGDSAIQVTGVKKSESLPALFQLYQSYPNPFNPKNTIRYELAERATVVLEVFDEIGRMVIVLDGGKQEAGLHEKEFDGAGMSSGIYFYRLSATTESGRFFTDSKKFTLIK